MRALPVLSLVGLMILLQVPGLAGETPAQVQPRRAIPATLHTIPPRPAAAAGGAEFVRRIRGLGRAEREAAILAEVLAGNIPDFLRELKPVTLRGRVAGRPMKVVVWATPDYLAVGSNDDFVRVPVNYYTALEIGHAFGMALPTRKIVDAIYAQSALQLRPQPMTPGPQMTSAQYFLVHNQRIENQRGHRALGTLLAGHKKDLVITNRLARQASPRVAIYGWHRGPGDPIQPLSTVHGAAYADYSHGLRLLGGVVSVNGVEWSFAEALQAPHVGPILSLEGTVRVPARIVSGLPAPAR